MLQCPLIEWRFHSGPLAPSSSSVIQRFFPKKKAYDEDKALHKGADFIWNRAWRTPSLRAFVKNIGDLVGEQLGGAGAGKQQSSQKFNREKPRGRQAEHSWEHCQLWGLKRLCVCGDLYPLRTIKTEIGTDFKAFPNTCRPITGQKLHWYKELDQTLTEQ